MHSGELRDQVRRLTDRPDVHAVSEVDRFPMFDATEMRLRSMQLFFAIVQTLTIGATSDCVTSDLVS